MTSLLFMLQHLQGTELSLSYFWVMEQTSGPKITTCMSIDSLFSVCFLREPGFLRQVDVEFEIMPKYKFYWIRKI